MKILEWLKEIFVALLLVSAVFVIIGQIPALVQRWQLPREIGWLTTLGLIVVLLLNSIVSVDPAEAGVVAFLGHRWRTIYEGPHLILPLGLERVIRISLKLATSSIDTSAFSRDRLEIKLPGSVQWAPDPEPTALRDFVALEEKTITDGLSDAVKDLLGIVTGSKNYKTFISRRGSVGDIIKAKLVLEKPPHLVPDAIGGQLEPRWSRNGRILDNYILDFYYHNMSLIREYIETHKPIEKSELEKRYKIRIETYALADVDFSPKTKEAIEREKQAEAESVGLLRLADKIKERRPEITDAEAINAAQSHLGRADKKVFSLEGLKNLFG